MTVFFPAPSRPGSAVAAEPAVLGGLGGLFHMATWGSRLGLHHLGHMGSSWWRASHGTLDTPHLFCSWPIGLPTCGGWRGAWKERRSRGGEPRCLDHCVCLKCCPSTSQSFQLGAYSWSSQPSGWASSELLPPPNPALSAAAHCSIAHPHVKSFPSSPIRCRNAGWI